MSWLLPADQERLDRLIAEVGTGLQGETGAGIFLFRRRLLEVPATVPCEVRAATGALARLETGLDEICGWSSARRS